MKTKVLLPMLAFICAIGMAFATTNLEPEIKVQNNDYVLIDGSWEIIPEQNCEQGSNTCRVQFGQGGPIYDVYDEMDLQTKKNSSTPDPTVLNL
ncbi:DUF6520 family protein [Salegentibacter sp. Hel_I_6]|uniref:DUF6520 family protein n=1 Tax=Salegentibacter sp. Hel_I_6 TaxID=1250278 RepID=UPI001E3E97EB|nr:DUF6520 family protein [Salegentibacter sp. Hel_I_6]